MDSLLKKALTVGFAVATGLGWQWTTLLHQAQMISYATRLYASISLTAAFLLQQIYLALPKPSSKARAYHRAAITETYLLGLLARYYEAMRSQLGTPEVPAIRINVMLPTLRWRGLGGRFLKIYYEACPDGVSYSDNELGTTWKRGQGLAGWVWKSGKDAVYDEADDELAGASVRLTEKQRNATQSSRSIYAVPILDGEVLVGVLNLDSREGLDKTSFNHAFVRELTQNYARALASQCFTEGSSCMMNEKSSALRAAGVASAHALVTPATSLPDDLRIRITSGENLTEAGRRALKNGIIVIGEVKRIQAQIEDKIPAPG